MTDGPCLAVAPDVVGPVVKGLAVLGGAVLGGLLTGVLAQLLVKALTARKVPRFPLLTLRLLGAILAGWLVALFVFGGGGSGLGGLGGWGFGPLEPKDSTAKKDGAARDTTDAAKDQSSGKGPGPLLDSVQRVEVLTDPAVEKVLGKDGVERRRFYRIEGARANDLLTFDALKEKIRERLQQPPPLQRLDIVTREDSPDKDVPRVAELRRWAEDQKLKVEFPPR